MNTGEIDVLKNPELAKALYDYVPRRNECWILCRTVKEKISTGTGSYICTTAMVTTKSHQHREAVSIEGVF